MRHILILVLSITVFCSAFAQLQVTGGNTAPFTPENLISNIFLGEGVEVTDITYSGDNRSVGYFTNGDSFGLGIERGVLLTSGFAASAGGGIQGADGNGSQFAGNTTSSSANDIDINNIASGVVNDLCKYSITFIPTSDTLRFEYIFASEEYPEYSCAFNDVFAFIISGPGISGPYENGGMNIAIVPGTNLPVTIDNVRPQNPTNGACMPFNEQFYNDNNGSNTNPVYDGYLDVFIAEAVVTPCEEYTIKLMIADVGDSAFDSGVFLAAKSFGTGSIDVETATVSLDGTITEGCAVGVLSFVVPNAPENELALDYTIFGSAVNGVDYSTIPTDLTFAAGQDSIGFIIEAFEDGIPEGIEFIGIDIQRDVCRRDTFYFYIKDTQIVPPDINNDTSVCQGSPVILHGELPIILPESPSFTSTNPFDIDTNHVAFYSDVVVFGVEPFLLQEGVIQSVCLNLEHTWISDFDIYLISPSGQFMELTTDNGGNGNNYTQTCFTPDATVPIVPVGTLAAPSSAAPFTGDWIPEGIWSDLWDGDYQTNGTWQLLIYDDAVGFDNGNLIDWTITFNPLYRIDYVWTPTNGLSCSDCPNPIANPNVSTMYYLTASDSYGCIVEDSIFVDVVQNLPAPEISCSTTGVNQLTASWNAIPGATDYILIINGGSPINLAGNITDYVLNGVVANTEFIIETVGGCNGLRDTTVCCLPPALSIASKTDETCFNENDGTVQILATGGVAPLVYDLDGVEANNSGGFIDISPGIHLVTIIDDVGCFDTIGFNIIGALEISSHIDLIDSISCFNENDGSAAVIIDSGQFPLSYIWSTTENDSVANALVAGWNYVTITDQNSCFIVDSIELSEPVALGIVIDNEEILCFGDNTGKAWVTASGGTAPYSYLWDNPNITILDTISNVLSGTYSVTVTDFHNCQSIGFVNIVEPTILTSGVSMTQATCNSSGDGSATVVSNGGTGVHTYLWDDINGQINSIASGLDVGWYHVTVTDENDCFIVDSIEITAPNQIVVSSVVDSTTCFYKNDGSISLTINGGTPSYVTTWSDIGVGPNGRNDLYPGIDSVIVTDDNACSSVHYFEIYSPDTIVVELDSIAVSCFNGSDGTINAVVNGGVPNYTYSWDDLSNQTSQNATNLDIGTYVLEVTDSKNCIVTASSEILNTDNIITDISKTDITCFGEDDGIATVSIVSGGIPNYTYLWNDALAQTNAQAIGLYLGEFIVEITDDNNCSVFDTIIITEPSPITNLITKVDINCGNDNNGAIYVVSNGGTGSYTYEWSNSETNDTIIDLSPNTYYLTTTDDNGCTKLDTVSIEIQDPIIVTSILTNISCNEGSDGVIDLTISGGVSGYNVSYNGVSGSALQTGLTAQIYFIEIEDAVGCVLLDTVTLSEPNPILLSTDIVSVECKDGFNGEIDLTISSTNSISDITWGGPNGYTSSNEDITGLYAGEYIVVVTDVNGCFTTDTYTVIEPDRNLEIIATINDVSCFGGTDGLVSLDVDGGTPLYTYLWSNGETGSSIVAGAGLISVIVTDSRQCSTNEDIIIGQPEAITTSFTSGDVTCFDGTDGRIDVTVTGGTAPFNFYLADTLYNNNGSILGVKAGDYIITLEDANGCFFDIGNVTISQPDSLIVDLGPDILIDLEQSTTINAIMPNGENIVLYEWTVYNELFSNDQSIDVQPEFTTIYTVKVTDDKGCFAYEDIKVILAKERQVHIPLGFSPNGDNTNEVLMVHGKPGTIVNSFSVYDKWGELLYFAKDFMINELIGWDGSFKGQHMPPGTYVWQVDVTYIEGLNEQYKGHTTLIK